MSDAPRPAAGWYDAVALYPVVAPLTRSFAFDPLTAAAAEDLLAAGPRRIYQELIRDRESQLGALVARRVLAGFLERIAGSPATALRGQPLTTSSVVEQLSTARDELHAAVDDILTRDGRVRTAVRRQRAPLALLGDCWLDTVSQPATQPAAIVNRLFTQHFAHHDGDARRHDQTGRRRRALEDAGVSLPHVTAPEFLELADARPVTAWHGAFYLALSRLAANFLPELIGLHCAHHLLAVDDHLLGIGSAVGDADVVAVLEEFLTTAATLPDRVLPTGTGPDAGTRLIERLRTGLRAGLTVEREHVEMLGHLADRIETMSLDAQVTLIIDRHAPYAGRQHRGVRLGGTPLTELLDPHDFDAVAVMRRLRSSRQVRPMSGGDSRFMWAIRFGGPMFGIFDADEAGVFERWIAAVQAGEEPDPAPLTDTVGQVAAAGWRDAVLAGVPDDVTFVAAGDPDERELFHRLVAIERHPNTLPAARARAEEVLTRAEILFEHGAAGRYTDASWFDYSPAALVERIERVYRDKLVDPYRPLTGIPDLDEVVFDQTRFALGNLIDGAWVYRIGAVGRSDQTADQMLRSIYADEMGRGDIRKNHITLIHRALASMSIMLPHIADPRFREQTDLPDSLYGISLYQLSLGLFADTLHDEILGYNLGVEMFGLGEVRMHEIEKLRHHGLDPCFEEAHLSIDNLSAGHARQSVTIITTQLEAVRRLAGEAAVADAWRRVWRGYASFAYFIEHALVRRHERTAGPAVSDTVLVTI